MTEGLSWAIITCGTIAAFLAAIANKALVEISWHDLEEYCRRRQREDAFDTIHDRWETAVATVETLQLFGALLAIVGLAEHAFAGVDKVVPSQLVKFILLVTLGALTVTVWMPREIAWRWGSAYLVRTWAVWHEADRLFTPIHAVSSLLRAMTRRLDGRDQELTEEEALEDEILSIVTEGQHDGLLEDDVREMIAGVIELDDTDVADIMTPRSDMDVVPIEMDWDEMLQFVIRVGRTRIPVYENQLDNIVGVLYVKDLLAVLAQPQPLEKRSLRDVIREIRFVPSSTRLDELLQTFLSTRGHLCMVVDEFMHVVGLVTIEDVLEEIVGEIVDESDAEEISDIHWVADGIAEVLGRAHIEEVNEALGIQLPESSEFDTVGGYILHELGRIPQEGESLQLQDVNLTVKEATRRRIELVRFELNQHPKILKSS